MFDIFDPAFEKRLRCRTILVPRNEFRCIIPCIDVRWISDMFSPILHWTFSSNTSLDIKTRHREHGKTPVLYLLYFQLCESLRIFSQSKWIESVSRMQWI